MVAAWWPCTLYAVHPSISKPKVHSVPGLQLAEAERKRDEIGYKTLLYILAESIILLFDYVICTISWFKNIFLVSK